MRLLLIGAIVIAGCYHPGGANCAIQCALPTDCPDGLGCGSSGLCSSDNLCAGDTPGSDGSQPDAAVCFGVFWQPCFPLPPGEQIVAENVDTNDGTQCTVVLEQPDSSSVCVIASETITITTLRATGLRPLVVLGDSVTIGEIDVSSGAVLGAGGCTSVASASMTGGTTQNNESTGTTLRYGAGGAGASMHGKGGAGGAVTATSPNPISVAMAGVSPQVIEAPSVLRGGCHGGNGGGSDVAGSAGSGGFGGGGVLVIARTQIAIAGPINASGGGGAGGQHERGGGGGGGAGGMIVLDAPMVSFATGSRLLSGGGGGGAANDDNGNTVRPGFGPNPNATAASAFGKPGASTSPPSGNGGAGSKLGDDDGDPAIGGSNFGGGGGGGGAGFILIFGAVDGSPDFELPTSIRSH